MLVDADDAPASVRAAALARQSGSVTVVDVDVMFPEVQELLRHIDVIVVSEGLPEQLTGAREVGEALSRMATEFQAPMVCVTLGAGGCLSRVGGREIHSPAFGVNCFDSTGAGDAFRGGLIAALLALGQQASAEQVLRYANAVAGLACRAPGARDGLPRPDEVATLLGHS
jgi:sulfofructose kinase